MKKIKQIVSFILIFSITFSTIFMLDTKDTYAASIKYVDNARSGITYSYDLDKDGKKEKILCLIGNDEYGYTLDLYINNKLKKTYSNLEAIPCVSIYDINKKDNNKEIAKPDKTTSKGKGDSLNKKIIEEDDIFEEESLGNGKKSQYVKKN